MALQSGMALRGWLVERREGLRRSRFRLAVVSALLAVITILALTATRWPEPKLQPTSNVSQRTNVLANATPTQTLSADPQIGITQQEKEQLLQERERHLQRIKEIDEKVASVNKPPEVSQPGSSPQVIPTTQTPDRPPLISREALTLAAVLGSAFLLMVGFLILMTSGPIRTLLPVGWFRVAGGSENAPDAQAELERLTAAVWRKDYAPGLAIAEKIISEDLDPFDRLDHFFLRAYCAVQMLVGENAEVNEPRRPELLGSAIAALETVVKEAPERGDSVYLLGLAYGMNSQHAEALAMFERAQKILAREQLRFDHNLSVCLLHLAQLNMSTNNMEQAEEQFKRVTNLNKLADLVVESRVEIGMNELRRAVKQKEMDAAAAAIGKLEGLKGLNPELRSQIELIHTTFRARIALRESDPAQALAQSESFLEQYLPKDLLPVDDEAADDLLSSLIEDEDLPFPREVFRGFFFIKAVALCQLESRSRTPLTEAQVARLAEPLLRGLQFEPRQRDLLGALGGLYYWFRKEKRQKALDWLEAAALMGVSGRIIVKILERDRLIEVERRESLDWFRSASARFLRDPSLAAEVRQALVEELGRFQEFEPMLISLEQRPDLQPEEPTLEIIRERAKYLSQLVADVSKRGQTNRARLTQIQAEYAEHLKFLERTIEGLTALERDVIEELGATLAL
jgi:tetratricopeptide (TPR) repeat protein